VRADDGRLILFGGEAGMEVRVRVRVRVRARVS
jgi:hypothetical protein